MRFVPRSRRRQRANLARRIEISQAEITADLEYRGDERRLGRVRATPARGHQ